MLENEKTSIDPILQQIKHEHDLLNHRLAWMWTLQGLLLTAFGFLVKNNLYQFPAAIVCLLACFSCISFGHILRIQANYLDELNNKTNGFTAITENAWLLPWRSLPLALSIAWFMLFIYVIYLILR